MEEGQPQIVDRPSEALPSLLGLGAAWTRIGYGVLGLSVVALAAIVLVRPAYGLPPGAHVPAGYHLISGKNFAKDGGMVVLASPLGFASVFVWVFSALASFAWTFVDLVDRRKRFVWLLPMFICPFTGLHALPLALYIFFARETLGHSEGVK